MRDGQAYDWRTWDLPSRCIVASGQKGRNPRIYVWRIVNPRGESTFVNQLLASLSVGAKRREVVQLSFNSTGSLLVALSHDMEHSLTIFDWRKGTKIREGKGHGDPVECVRFNPFSSSAFASCGTKHLKFWEMGDTDTGMEMAVGLFGELGESIDINCIEFHPRGLTFTGNAKGEIYVWSNGTVTALYPNAHKGKVMGLLFVEGVALFSAGIGGCICMWDPELKDKTNPIGKLDLNSFFRNGSPRMLQRLSGRSLDWSTSPHLLKLLSDDNIVLDVPTRGVCGAPATHLSLADLGAEGVLLVGTSLNSIIAVGIKRVSDWASKGLPPAHQLQGHSSNSVLSVLLSCSPPLLRRSPPLLRLALMLDPLLYSCSLPLLYIHCRCYPCTMYQDISIRPCGVGHMALSQAFLFLHAHVTNVYACMLTSHDDEMATRDITDSTMKCPQGGGRPQGSVLVG